MDRGQKKKLNNSIHNNMCTCTHNHTSFTVNSKYDPTKLTALRNLFVKDVDKRFATLEKAVYTKVVTEDCFGLEPQIGINKGVRAAYAFPRSADKVSAFMEWLQEQVDAGILSVKEYQRIGQSIEEAWTNKYVMDSYRRGLIRARMELQKAGYNVPSIDATGGIEMSMMVPLHMDLLGLLYTRVFTDLKGITDAMDAQIARVLAQGIADGDGAAFLAKKLVATINGTGMGDLSLTDTLGRFIPARRRAQMLARTETTRAHHQATIREYMNWAVEGVVVLAEMLTTGDERVCSVCESLAGNSPYTLTEAMNLIPVHPNCRCICLPFEVGVDTLIQPKTK